MAAWLLVAPMVLFLAATLLLSIVLMVVKSTSDTNVRAVLPGTIAALKS